ncbi:MAG: hypothetical protein U9R08_05525 [Nanoarchaeota archaeon]|nr:hypothetical protein [Nanoarchaeota archaeon]
MNWRKVSVSSTMETETSIYHNIFLHSPECFAYQDHLTGRIYNEIDIAKFDEIHLAKCVGTFQGTDLGYGVRLTLRDDDKTIKIISRNINSDWKARRVIGSVKVRYVNDTIRVAELVTEVWFREPVGSFR